MVSQKKQSVSILVEMAEPGWLPDAVIRLGIRMLDQKLLQMENKGDAEAQRTALSQFIGDMRRSPIVV